MNVEDISNTKLMYYLKLAVNEQSPQIYKPRSGLVNGNFDKFNRVQLDFMVEYTYNQLALFGYYDTYLAHKANPVEEISR